MEEQQSKKKPNERSNLRSNAFIRYSSMGTQMAIIIMLGVWGGKKLDEAYPRGFPLFTLICSLIGSIVAMYLAIKDLLRKT